MPPAQSETASLERGHPYITSGHYLRDAAAGNYSGKQRPVSDLAARLSIGDDKIWLQMTACESLWMPNSFFSLTAAAASGRNDTQMFVGGARGPVATGSRLVPAVPAVTETRDVHASCKLVFTPVARRVQKGPIWLGFP